jgi:putative FmdB family regulatory protein
MPVYEYACASCDERFEEIAAAADSPDVACPSCGSKKVERLYSSFSTRWRPSLVKWHRLPGKRGGW